MTFVTSQFKLIASVVARTAVLEQIFHRDMRGEDFIENEACRDKVVLDNMASIRFENFRRKYGYKSEIAIWRYTESLEGLESL